MPFTFQPLPQTEARDRIAGLPLVTREMMDNMLPELRAYAFTLTGLDVGDQMARVRDEIAAVPMGAKTWAQAKKTIAADLKEKLGGKESQRRAELLLRTHVFRGYAAARYRALMAQIDVFPYWQYKTHGDGNVRPSHAALNGKIFPAGHDIWQQIFPPWDWGCRCLVVPLTAGAVSRIQDAGMPSNKDASLLPTQIAKPEVFTAREADLINQSKKLPGGISLNHAPTWSAAPWSIPGNIRHDWPLIEARYGDQPEVLEAFRSFAMRTEISEAGMTMHQWISGEGFEKERIFPRAKAPSPGEVKAILGKLAQNKTAKLSQKIRKITGAPKTGPLSSSRIKADLDDIAAILPADLVEKMDGIEIRVKSSAEMGGIAATFNEETRVMSINADGAEESTQTLAHETMHWAWPHLSRQTRESVREHLLVHSAGRQSFTRRGVKYLGGDWIDPLAGREDGTELLPYHFEKLFDDPATLAQYLTTPVQRSTFNLMAEALGLKQL